MTSRLLSMLAALALLAGAAQPAAAAPADDDALGVLQQGKGQGGGQGGGGQEARGGRGQGGGGQEARGSGGQGGGGQGGGGQARESRGRSGGGSDARPSGQSGSGQGSARASGERSKGSSGGNSGSARSSERGRSSDAARGNTGGSGNASGRSGDRGAGSGNSANASGRGNSGAAADRPSNASGGRGRLSGNDLQSRIAALPAAQRRLANSSRAGERMAVGAIARGHARGLAADAFDVRSDNDRVRILNRRGDLLFDMDHRRAGELGGWQMRRLGDQSPRANAPAFCRSGAGHPVWGREWCIEKGFGLGSRSGTIWSRGGIGDVIFRNPDYRTRLDRGGLLGVLGDIVLGRLALQSMALGYDQPLTGYWVADPSGPYLLRVNSGPYEVAEFYDNDRDNRVEVLYVVQPVW